MPVLIGFTLLLILQIAGETIARLFDLSVPGPVVGLVLLLAGLIMFRSLEARIEPASRTLLSHLSLLFVPAGVGISSHIGKLDDELLPVLITVGCSTVLGLVVTASLMQWLGPPKDQMRPDSEPQRHE